MHLYLKKLISLFEFIPIYTLYIACWCTKTMFARNFWTKNLRWLKSLYSRTTFISFFFLQVIIIRLYEGAFLWPRRNHQKDFSIVEILKEQECLISVGIQRQGESVALNPEGNSYFTHSEFVNQTLWKFDILEESYERY